MVKLETESRRDTMPVSASEAGEVTTKGARINIPLNLNNWKKLPPDVVEQLQWFHQYILSEGLGYEEITKALDYDNTVIWRVLKGTYEGSWPNIVKAIKKYRAEVNSLAKLKAARGTIQQVNFVQNSVCKRIDWILDYTLSRARSSLILGDGGIGKTEVIKWWSRNNNHGRSVLVECLPVGGAKGLLRQVAEKVGVNKTLGMTQMLDAVIRAFDDTRILILDEIQHHVPSTSKSNPIALEMARRIKDLSGCGLAMFGTNRCESSMKSNIDFYQQIMRRAGRIYYLPDTFEDSDIRPIVTQFIQSPSKDFMEVIISWANDPEVGRLNYIVDTLAFAAKIAHDKHDRLTEERVLAGHQLRENRSKKG